MRIFKKYGIIIVIAIIILSFLIEAFIRIDNKKTVSYTLDRKEYKEIQLENDLQYSFFIVPKANKMLTYSILKANTDGIGDIQATIKDDSGNVLYTNIVKSLQGEESVDIDVSSCNLLYGEKYELILQPITTSNIILNADLNNELHTTTVYTFNHNIRFKNCMIAIFLLFIILIILVRVIKDIHKQFFVTSMLIGLIAIFIIPPCVAPDEFRHFARAYNIADGNVICDTYKTKEEFYNQTLQVCDIPNELFQLKLISESNGETFDREWNTLIFFDRWADVIKSTISKENVEIPIHGTATISPIVYFPQVIFIYFAKILGGLSGGIYYFAKFGNLLIATILGTIAIYIVPKFKKGIFVLWFIPSIVFLRSSCSTDGILFALIILLLSIFIKMKNDNEGKERIKYYICILLIELFIAQIKLPYTLSVFFFLLVNNKPEKKENVKKLKYIIVPFGIFVISIAGYSMVQHFFISNGVSSTAATNNYILYFFQHPIKIVNMIIQSLLNDTWSYLQNAIVIQEYSNLQIIYVIIIIFTVLRVSNSVKLNDIERKLLIGGSILAWTAILVVFYFLGSSPSLGYIWGVQERYLLPIIPFTLLGVSKENGNVKLEGKFQNIQMIVIMTVIIYCYQLFFQYWI